MSDNKYEALKLENQLCFPLYACARKVVSQYTPLLKPLGITYTQYIVFMVLWENDGLTVGELGNKLSLDNGTLTPMLKKLEQAGFVTRLRDKDDERKVTIHLTEEGWALRDKVSSVPEQVGACIQISPEEARVLYGLLYKIIGTL